MTPAERRAYAREWRARHPGYLRDYYRAHPDKYREYAARSRAKAKDRPCRVEGCPEPRYVSPGGYVDTRCRQHEAEHARERYLASMAKPRGRGVKPYIPRRIPAAERPCLGPYAWTGDEVYPSYEPCPNPRFVHWDGRVDARCAEHSVDAGPAVTPTYPATAQRLREQGGRCACCRRRIRPSSAYTDAESLVCWRCDRMLRQGDTEAIGAYLTSRRTPKP